MIDFKLIIKKIIMYKQYQRIIKVLKKSVKATIITKYILNLKINLRIAKLLAFVLTIKK